MKILSKHKDYYDYLTGIYGIDPVLYYDRRKMPVSNLTNDLCLWRKDMMVRTKIHINHQYYTIFSYNQKFYHTSDELFELFVILRKSGSAYLETHSDNYRCRYSTRIYYKDYFRSIDKFSMEVEGTYLRKIALSLWNRYNKRPTELNKEHRQPVLADTGYGIKIPILDSIAFQKAMTAHEVYGEISEFLGWMNDNPEAPQNTDNDSKIVMAGFDKKISFRHRK